MPILCVVLKFLHEQHFGRTVTIKVRDYNGGDGNTTQAGFAGTSYR